MDEAVDSGFEAIVVTVDAPRGGNRERDLRTGFRIPEGLGVPSVAAALRLRAGGDDRGDLRADGPRPRLARTSRRSPPSAACRSWSRACMTGEDAALAVEHGAAGVVVSNHGGRQLDRVAGDRRRPRGGGRRGRRPRHGPRRRRHPPRRRRRGRPGARRRRGAGRPAGALGPRRRRRGGRRGGCWSCCATSSSWPWRSAAAPRRRTSAARHVQRAPATSVYSV